MIAYVCIGVLKDLQYAVGEKMKGFFPLDFPKQWQSKAVGL